MLRAGDLVQLFQLGLEVHFLSLEMEDGRLCNLGEGGRGREEGRKKRERGETRGIKGGGVGEKEGGREAEGERESERGREGGGRGRKNPLEQFIANQADTHSRESGVPASPSDYGLLPSPQYTDTRVQQNCKAMAL